MNDTPEANAPLHSMTPSPSCSSTSTSIQVLVCDLGKVLLPFDFGSTKTFLKGQTHKSTVEDPWRVLIEIHDGMGYGTGKCDTACFYQEVAAQLDLGCTFEEFRTAYCEIFKEDMPVIKIIERVRVPHRFLLSNTNSIHWEWIIEHHPAALQPFDHLLPSHEFHALKPDPQIYRKVEALTGLGASSHLLIDDIEANIEGAQACGWDGILYSSAASLRKALESRGLLDP